MEEIITILVQIEYSINDGEYPYADIIVLEADDYLALTEQEIEQMKLDRYNEWKSKVKEGV
jgi:hypothetical protein